MLNRYWFPLLLALGVATGCGVVTVDETPLNAPPAPMAPRDPSKVDVFTAGPPSKPYVEVAMLEARQDDMYSSDQTTIAKLRDYAAHKGCDAIVVTGASERQEQNSLDKKQKATLKSYRATCIVYKPSDDSSSSSTAKTDSK